MSHELRIERLIDAPPEVVFDAFVDPATQEELHGSGRPGWTVQRSETDARVGGTSIYAMGFEGDEPDVETRVYSVVDRPNRVVFRHSMEIREWGRTVETEMTITFEGRDGKTLLTMVQTGFENAEDRDAFQSGWPAYLDSLQSIAGQQIKARHDTGA
jgi:uncharacterized protein YndB with AHSA1/START domain